MVEKEKVKSSLNGSLEQKRMEAEKRKHPNGSVMATVNGVTNMHLLKNVHLEIGDTFKGTLGEFIDLTIKAQDVHTKTSELQTKAILSLDKKIKNLEKVVQNNGLE